MIKRIAKKTALTSDCVSFSFPFYSSFKSEHQEQGTMYVGNTRDIIEKKESFIMASITEV